MRRWTALPLLFVMGFAALMPEDASQARAADPVVETFRTADGVQLQGLFHKSEVNPGSDPVVIMMYPPGKDKDMTKGDWKGLANKLAAKGFNVFRFDWRGHGQSTDIKDVNKFWNIPTPNNPNIAPNPFSGPWNVKYITGAPVGKFANKRIKNDLYYKDIKDPVRYAPTLLLDLAAVRYHLDTKNDAGEVNTSSIYLIGSEVTATLGMAWMTAEWNRPKTAPNENALGGAPRYEYVPQPLFGTITEAGEDISGAIWLSGTRPTSVRPQLVQDWVSRGATKLRDNNPMLFLYAGKDQKAQADADFFYHQVLVANPPKTSKLQPLEFTKIREIKNKDGKAIDLTGVALLGNNAQLETEDTIEKFLQFLQKDRAKIVRKNRNFDKPYFIDLSKFGLIP